MKSWQNPVVSMYDENLLKSLIRAKACSFCGTLDGAVADACMEGVGATTQAGLSDGQIADIYVQSFDAVTNVFTVIINGVRHFFSWSAGLFT